MSIRLVGLNHHTAPVEVREQLAFSRDGGGTALMLFNSRFPQCEAALISTCNRVEMLIATEGEHPSRDEIVSFLAEARDVPVPAFRPYLYELDDEDAVRHLFSVAAGLDSMVIGETQIVSQLKAAYAAANERNTAGRILHRLFHHTFAVSKRIRSETTVGEGRVSLPAVAVAMMGEASGDLTEKDVVVAGAGEMAQLVCQYLRDAGAGNLTITTRSMTNGRALAGACDAEAAPFSQFDVLLAEADVVVTATACPNAIVTKAKLAAVAARRERRPLVLVDLSVPRNVEPKVNDLDFVTLIDIDALGRRASDNQRQRLAAVDESRRILEQELSAFHTWLAQCQAEPVIEQMYGDARDLRDLELSRFFSACPSLTEEEADAVRRLAERLTEKLMFPCVSTMRRHSLSEPSSTLAKTLHKVAIKQRGQTASMSRS